jgi:hypothetical protein
MDKPWRRTRRYKKLAAARVRKYDQSKKGKERRRRWSSTTSVRERSFNKWLKTRYGIDAEIWKQMFLDQKGMCAGCGQEIKGGRETHVDHDHVTGKVRSLLCRRCNMALGFVKDSIQYLRALIKKKKKHASC